MSSQGPAEIPKHPPSDGARQQGQPVPQTRGRMSAPAPNNRNAGMHNNPNNQKGRNPVGSPPPNQRNSRPMQPQQQQQQSSQGRGPGQQRPRPMQARSKSVSQIGEAERAALALAAVAQAASASNRSPAEAAEIAKAQAHHLSKKNQGRRPQQQPASLQPRKIQLVNIETVKGLLRSEAAVLEEAEHQPSKLLEKLADGGNDSFMQHLLLFEHLRAEEDDISQMEDMESENMKTSYACERIQLLLGKMECAYDSLASMLPDVPPDALPEIGLESESDDVETPKVVPDLLPPCTSNPGDATLMFFRACMGEKPDQESEEKCNSGDHNVITESTDPDSKAGHDAGSKDGFVDHEDKQTSVFSSMFRMKSPGFNKKGFAAVFGKKRKGGKSDDAEGADENDDCETGEYTAQIEREMLGLTVENVLERTVVRTVLAGGPAKKAGAKVGSLIVKVGNIETKNLTHFETIDELRQSQRPLQLVLRQISDDALRSAREEMGRLIRGSGFGKIIDGEPLQETKSEGDLPLQKQLGGGDSNIDIFSSIVRKRWLEAANLNRRQTHESILRVGEKLVWIMTLFVIGLEREAARLMALAKENEADVPQRNSHSQYHHTAKDYSDAAKSVAKVLFDFVKKLMDPGELKQQDNANFGGRGPGGRQGPRGGPMGRGGRGRGRGGRGTMSMVPGMPDLSPDDGSSEKLLLQIGDVLQRTRTFLADPTSPPAALLRGEVIACLCDILDADTEMKLSEEENESSTQGGKAGPITDLGAAGSLLKLIVLNCPIMRSPRCEEISSENSHIDEDELKRRFGEKKAISGSDYHRLHAGDRFLAVVHRLAASRSTSARITACSLGPVLWSHLDFPHQLQVSVDVRNFCHFVWETC